MKNLKSVKVIGAGLAGSEAAWQLAKRGVRVTLYEMKPQKYSPAHSSKLFAELVCSNSLRSDSLKNAVGILKEEMRYVNSLIMEAAKLSAVPAGSSLAVDREEFSKYITEKIYSHPLIEVVNQEITDINLDEYTIIATGPLTSDELSKNLQQLLGMEYLHFFDAAAPIIAKDSIDFTKAYYKDRWDDDGEGHYINCPMNKEEFEKWYQAVITAETVPLKDFEEEIYFEGCMPFEEVAKRGPQTLLYGAMKPVGLMYQGVKPHAVVQLRQDNITKTLYNMVGFQTHLTWPEQKRIVRMIPGLENAEIIRYGVMHRNTYLNAPLLLNQNYNLHANNKIYFAGQITGVEGYVESCASGIVSALSLYRRLVGEKEVFFPRTSVMGSMSYYISNYDGDNFQPMNANFGLLPELSVMHKKRERKELYAKRALAEFKDFFDEYYR